MVVLLPAPLGPSRLKISPGAMSKLTPSTASTPLGGSYCLRSSRTSTIATAAPPPSRGPADLLCTLYNELSQGSRVHGGRLPSFAAASAWRRLLLPRRRLLAAGRSADRRTTTARAGAARRPASARAPGRAGCRASAWRRARGRRPGEAPSTVAVRSLASMTTNSTRPAGGLAEHDDEVSGDAVRVGRAELGVRVVRRQGVVRGPVDGLDVGAGDLVEEAAPAAPPCPPPRQRRRR